MQVPVFARNAIIEKGSDSRSYESILASPLLQLFPVIANVKCRTYNPSSIQNNYWTSFAFAASFMSSNVIADRSHMPRKIPDKAKRLAGVSNS